MARIEFTPKHRQPSGARVALATIVALAGSLIADAAIIAIGTRVFPSTGNGYVHFRFSDDGKVTAIGVLIACVAWPFVTRISTAPRGYSSAWPFWSHWFSGCPTSTFSTKGNPVKQWAF